MKIASWKLVKTEDLKISIKKKKKMKTMSCAESPCIYFYSIFMVGIWYIQIIGLIVT